MSNLPLISFEFFPPKTLEMENKLWICVKALEPLAPGFVSVTYGAGGTTRARTHQTVRRIVQETSLNPAAHLTCVDASRADVDQVAHDYWEAGVRHIVALRGDPPQATGAYLPHPQGYCYASELVAGLKKLHDFEISVAAFPEKHPESKSFEQDMDVLKKKIDAGATRAITQYFFDTNHYLRLVDRVRAAGITIPVLPGILPIGNFAQVKKFSAMCGASIPESVHAIFSALDDHPEERNNAAVAFATRQCQELIKAGVHDIHFYTLNRADLTASICKNIGIVAP